VSALTPYPARFDVAYPGRPLNRLTTAFRRIVALPILIVAATIGGGSVAVPVHGGAETFAAGGGVLFLGPLLMIVFRAKYPRWWFDWNRELLRFGARVGAYLALLDDRKASLGAATRDSRRVLGRRRDGQDRLMGKVEEPLGHAAEHDAGQPRVAAGPDDDQVCPRLGGDLGDRAGRTADHHVAHLDAGLDPLLRELLRLPTDLRLDRGLVGMDVAAALGGDSLVDMDDHDLGAVALRQLDGELGGAPRAFRTIEREHDCLEHGDLLVVTRAAFEHRSPLWSFPGWSPCIGPAASARYTVCGSDLLRSRTQADRGDLVLGAGGDLVDGVGREAVGGRVGEVERHEELPRGHAVGHLRPQLDLAPAAG
jgi:hypothetical protein